MHTVARTILAAFALVSVTGIGLADVYSTASFTGAINPGGANVKSPFSGNGFSQGQGFSGSFVFDNTLIPAPGSGFVNVFQQSFPDIAVIPPAVAFNITFGTLAFNASNNDNSQIPLGIQYNNGHFNGFEFITNFSFQSRNFQFRIDGPSVSVFEIGANGFPGFNSFINATINTGDNNLTNIANYVPPVVVTPGVPEPATWGLMLMGFAGLGFALRRRSRALAPA